MGFTQDPLQLALTTTKLSHYPSSPIRFKPDAEKYNIVMLVVESGHINVDSETIPNIYNLTQTDVYSDSHYSGGNTTRFGF